MCGPFDQNCFLTLCKYFRDIAKMISGVQKSITIKRNFGDFTVVKILPCTNWEPQNIVQETFELATHFQRELTVEYPLAEFVRIL